MTKMILLVLLVIGVTSCIDNSSRTTIEPRTLFVFGHDTTNYEKWVLESKSNYLLRITENDTVKVFKYIDSTDSTRGSSFKFRKKNGDLIWFAEKFKVIDSADFKLNDGYSETFYLYEYVNLPIDGNGPFYFNPSFGTLNMDNYSNQFIYLKIDSLTVADKILKALAR